MFGGYAAASFRLMNLLSPSRVGGLVTYCWVNMWWVCSGIAPRQQVTNPSSGGVNIWLHIFTPRRYEPFELERLVTYWGEYLAGEQRCPLVTGPKSGPDPLTSATFVLVCAPLEGLVTWWGGHVVGVQRRPDSLGPDSLTCATPLEGLVTCLLGVQQRRGRRGRGEWWYMFVY